ncbi:hypothetical protein ES319_A01G225400v1 [Gossypium barbadense]|uniref:Carbonic anhydrase n=2 Tax=Gossypium TaxID=3633 RepID=A0A5J5X349_GOSBA|nr:hypothetical protein ES319_A01G225400v1 [Gossypium barbadense]TYH32326.1 hypothetical protein ES288_A01G243300v1 [Gossypium darwinii]
MKNRTIPAFIHVLLIFSALFHSHSTSVSAQEVEDEKEFSYSEESGKGPSQWGNIKKEWSDCKTGKIQSPIDILSRKAKVIKNPGRLEMLYKPTELILQIHWLKSAGSIKINGTEYFLQQAHWHSPSEHAIDGRRYALEVHLVHQAKDPKVKHNLAVVGLLYKYGKPDAFLSKLLGNISATNGQIHEKPLGFVDPTHIDIRMGGKAYYRYIGSLTVPPCTEGVIWSVQKQVKQVSKEQVHAIRVLVHDKAEENARPVQPLNQREVELYSLI